MSRYGKVILATIGIIAAIIIPLALISGAVIATSNYNEYQVASTPVAKVSKSDVTDSTVKVTFSIDRSNLVINSKGSAAPGSETKYDYVGNYLIWIIDMDAFNEAKKEAEASHGVANITAYKDREIEIVGDKIYIDDVLQEGVTLDITTTEVYLLTADTSIQGNKTYYEKKGNDYEEVYLKAGTLIEKGIYYEKANNTSFSFTINKLYSKHSYAVGIQFYYSVNDVNSTLYNKNLQEREEFITK